MAEIQQVLKAVGFGNFPVYSVDGMFLIRSGDLPDLMKKALDKFMAGQTRPLVSADGEQDFIYLHDFDNFLHKVFAGKELFWD